jgi:hypothetical protein
MANSFYYFDKVKGKMVEGHPPDTRTIFGQAPNIICDTIPKYRHPGNGEIIESRRRLIDVDKMCGTITTDQKLPPNPSRREQEAKRKKEERMRELHEAVAQVDAGTAPLTAEVKAKCEQRNEQLSRALGIDAFNVAGRKDDRKGKRVKN